MIFETSKTTLFGKLKKILNQSLAKGYSRFPTIQEFLFTLILYLNSDYKILGKKPQNL